MLHHSNTIERKKTLPHLVRCERLNLYLCKEPLVAEVATLNVNTLVLASCVPDVCGEGAHGLAKHMVPLKGGRGVYLLKDI